MITFLLGSVPHEIKNTNLAGLSRAIVVELISAVSPLAGLSTTLATLSRVTAFGSLALA